MRLRTLLPPFLLAGLLAAGLSAAPPPAEPVGNVSNLGVGAVLPEHEVAMRGQIERIAREGAAMVAVAAVDDVSPMTTKEWAVEAFEKWGVGEAGKDNGVLVVFALKQRRIEVETGYGIEGRLPDAAVGRLLDRHAIPEFKRGRWGEGLVALLRGIGDHLTPSAAEARAAPPARSRRRAAPREVGGLWFGLSVLGAGVAALLTFGYPIRLPAVLAGLWLAWALSFPMRHLHVDRKFWSVGGLVAAVVFWMVGGGYAGHSPAPELTFALVFLVIGCFVGAYTRTRACPRCHVGYVDVERRTLRAATYSSAGSGRQTVDCPRCPYRSTTRYTIPRRTRQSSSSSYSSSSSSWGSGSSSSWGSSSSYSSGSSSSWSGGSSFGGGSSGGGGAGRSF